MAINDLFHASSSALLHDIAGSNINIKEDKRKTIDESYQSILEILDLQKKNTTDTSESTQVDITHILNFFK